MTILIQLKKQKMYISKNVKGVITNLQLVCCGHHKTFFHINQLHKFIISHQIQRFHSLEAEVRLSGVF